LTSIGWSRVEKYIVSIMYPTVVNTNIYVQAQTLKNNLKSNYSNTN